MPSPASDKRASAFTSIDQLRPDTSGHNLVVKVGRSGQLVFPHTWQEFVEQSVLASLRH